MTPKDRLESAISAIRSELRERLNVLNGEGKLLEAQRLEQRTKYDLEMLGQVGYCNGVENYARHLAGREEGTPPECLIDYFPDDWLLIVDEATSPARNCRRCTTATRPAKVLIARFSFAQCSG